MRMLCEGVRRCRRERAIGCHSCDRDGRQSIEASTPTHISTPTHPGPRSGLSGERPERTCDVDARQLQNRSLPAVGQSIASAANASATRSTASSHAMARYIQSTTSSSCQPGHCTVYNLLTGSCISRHLRNGTCAEISRQNRTGTP